MGSVSLSSLVWGLATLGQREGPLLDAIAVRALQLGTNLDAQVRFLSCLYTHMMCSLHSCLELKSLPYAWGSAASHAV